MLENKAATSKKNAQGKPVGCEWKLGIIVPGWGAGCANSKLQMPNGGWRIRFDQRAGALDNRETIAYGFESL